MTTLLALLGVLAGPQEPQEASDPFEWARALDDLDLSWRWGEFAFELSGALDLEFFVFGDEAPGVHVEDSAIRSDEYERGATADSPEMAGRFQLFLDGFVRDWLEYSAELRMDGTTAVDGNVGARFEQLWARVRLPDTSALNFQAGKFAAPVGNFIPRSSARKNPLTTWPLPYDHVTALANLGDPPAAILARRDAPDVKDWYVPIWQAIYGVGVMAAGSVAEWSYAVAVTNSAPATLPFEWDSEIGDPDFMNLYLHAGYALDIATRIGASWSRGPFEHRDPPGADAEDSYQTLFGVDFEYARGDFVLFAEFFWTRLDTPLAGDLDLWTGYVEGKYTLLPGLFGAARLAQMYFGDVEDAAGESHQWDRDVTRVEAGGGYFFTANLFLKATLQLNYHQGGREPDDHMLMLQVGLTF